MNQGWKNLKYKMQLHRKQVPKTETMVLSKNDYGYCLDVMVQRRNGGWIPVSTPKSDFIYLFI